MIITVRKYLPRCDDFTFTAIDFERANNAQSSICQLGLCVVERGRIVRSYEYFVRPPKKAFYFQRNAVQIHGITYEDVRGAPTFDRVWKAIFPDIEGRALVAHSFRDDALTLDAALRCYGIRYEYRSYGHLCTLELAQRADIHDENNKYNLEALCALYGIELLPHHAGSDAQGCAMLAMEMARALSIDSFKELADFSQTPAFPEPQLPDELSCDDLWTLESYITKMKNKKGVRLEDCPKQRDLLRAQKIMEADPRIKLKKESAVSAKELNKWIGSSAAQQAPQRRYSFIRPWRRKKSIKKRTFDGG